ERLEARRRQDIRQKPANRNAGLPGLSLGLAQSCRGNVDGRYLKSLADKIDGVASGAATQVHCPALADRALAHHPSEFIGGPPDIPRHSGARTVVASPSRPDPASLR